MKTKYLLFILGLFCCINIKAIEKEIILYNSTEKGDRTKSERSIYIEPTATIDGNTIHIQPHLPVAFLQIIVTDSYNNPMYSNNDTACSRSHTFELNTLPEGEYIVEFTIGDKSFYGYFSISKSIM